MPTPAAQPERRLRNLLHPVVLQGISKTYRLDAVDVPALVDINLVILPDRFTVISGPVSYTHLRAHETVLDIVCRLLLEKTN